MPQRTVAIIGAGIGDQHLDAFLQLENRFKVRTVCDLDEERAAGLAHRAGGCDVSNNMHAAIADPTIEVIDVCLPPHMHYDACSLALASGKNVICEKPLVTSLRECDELIAHSDKAPGTIFPVFQYRYGLGCSQLRALVEAGLAGTPYVATLETHWNRDADYYAVPWRGTWTGEQGGAVLGHAIHIHDWLSFVLGPVRSVYAALGTRVNDIEVEDCAALSIQMESGALVTSSITLGAVDDTSRLRFCFERLTAESGRSPYAPADDKWTFTARDPAQQAEIAAVLANVETPKSGYAGLFDAIADCLDGKPGNEVTIADARRALGFVTAVYQSSRTRSPVEFPIEHNDPLYDGWALDKQAGGGPS